MLEVPLKADFALLRGRAADTMGNVVYNKTARNHQAVMATAADTVVVEVGEIVAAGSLDPEAIITPCIFVDRVFMAERT
ncbi:3-oxoadipate CoA-transferase subunit A [compost metagenome]